MIIERLQLNFYNINMGGIFSRGERLPYGRPYFVLRDSSETESSFSIVGSLKEHARLISFIVLLLVIAVLLRAMWPKEYVEEDELSNTGDDKQESEKKKETEGNQSPKGPDNQPDSRDSTKKNDDNNEAGRGKNPRGGEDSNKREQKPFDKKLDTSVKEKEFFTWPWEYWGKYTASEIEPEDCRSYKDGNGESCVCEKIKEGFQFPTPECALCCTKTKGTKILPDTDVPDSFNASCPSILGFRLGSVEGTDDRFQGQYLQRCRYDGQYCGVGKITSNDNSAYGKRCNDWVEE